MSALLAVADLRVHLGARAVVDGIGFALDAGEALGIVGESGSGKSQTALAVLGLCDASARLSGSVQFAGRELIGLRERDLHRIRGAQLAAVFQNPAASLNPHLRIGVQLAEGQQYHLGRSRAAALAEAHRLLDAVRVADAGRRLHQYPHELSGGMCQRVALAMALACEPRLLIADEPTTALDVTTQARMLELIGEQCRERGLALLLISHDLGVVSELCREAVVMRAGQIVERGMSADLLSAPQHPYTAALVEARRMLGGARP
ncbi:ABC transporter ATP-binding protein [Sinimarinibacterium flocculans]|uniref:Peptide/nickel transport system ATP-binding protein/oligopeptide transport system ATP-binding protein n=1 Tax=Sinimarinibacterium flocculans TaxID=985250 RepID=A0A318EFY9_9GAMM|nr:ABC transporter ATP-binding protein [Sinimarinibacterium flocculans]PXV69636.1 peptide/nickel transport system ATP-binding protein/oligopeptide transport system ATP-binding protein [Sinimarinibacterium flocculans]